MVAYETSLAHQWLCTFFLCVNVSKLGKDTSEIFQRHDPPIGEFQNLKVPNPDRLFQGWVHVQCLPLQHELQALANQRSGLHNDLWNSLVLISSNRTKNGCRLGSQVQKNTPSLAHMLGIAHCYNERQHNCWTAISVGLLFQRLHAEALGPLIQQESECPLLAFWLPCCDMSFVAG